MDLLHHLSTFFRNQSPSIEERGGGVVVAFSGGPDSSALLLALTRLAEFPGHPLGPITAAHLDHGLDPGSAGRAEAAASIAERLQATFLRERREVAQLRLHAESPEAAARRVRYGFLEEVRQARGARWVATAHHRDDQAETVLLRLLFGSGLEGLAGIRPVQGRVVRPLLDVPREALREAVEAAGLPVVEDPTNQDLSMPRNRVRHLLLPALEAHQKKDLKDSKDTNDKQGSSLLPLASLESFCEPGLRDLLARVAERAAGASAVLGRRLANLLRFEALADGVSVDRRTLQLLPEELFPFALAAIHRRAGAPYPAGSAARRELLRQLRQHGSRTCCDAGGGWVWRTIDERSDRLELKREQPEEQIPHFSYTLEVPGELHIPEIGVGVGLHRRPVEPWMFQGSPHRAGLALPLASGDRVTVRNRLPGDRLHPLGASGSRRLKEVLIDWRMPNPRRDRLPLVCVGGRIAWVPGVTIDERFRVTGQATAWVASLTETS